MAETAKKAAPMFEVTVEGTYYGGERNAKVHRPFKPEKFILPSLKDAQHTIMRKLLAQRLTTKYNDFVAVRTCKIIDTKETTASANRPVVEIPISEMNLAQLSEFAIAQDLQIDPNDCASVTIARKAVQDALDDKALLARQQRESVAASKKEADDRQALEDLNKVDSETDGEAGAAPALDPGPDEDDTTKDGPDAPDPLAGLE